MALLSKYTQRLLVQCITRQRPVDSCSNRSSGSSALPAVRAMAEPEQEAQPEATQLDETQSVDQYGVPYNSPAPVTPPEAFFPRNVGKGPTFTPVGSRFVSRPPELGKGRDRDIWTDPYRQGPGQWLPQDLVKGGYWTIDEDAVRAAGWVPLPQWSKGFDWDARTFDPIEAL